MSGDHISLTRDSFAQQSVKFDDPNLTLANAQHLEWMTTAIAPSKTDSVLDVASGTGHLALALAPLAHQVVSLDATAEMQAQARAKAQSQALTNISFVLGEAEALPFPDAAFDRVTCRFAFHHFVDPSRVLNEMARVCKRAGRVVVIDLVAPADEPLTSRYNHFERLRDPSHTNALTNSAFRTLFAERGLRLTDALRREVPVSVERWLDLTSTPLATRATIASSLERELSGGEPTGMFPVRRENGLFFKQEWWLYSLTAS